MSQVLSGPKKLNQVVVVIQRHSDDQNIDRSSSMPSANPAINKTNIGVDDATAVSTSNLNNRNAVCNSSRKIQPYAVVVGCLHFQFRARMETK